ncbi:hypothetical protein [Alkaliphilus sp. B6464]|uniref:hypothetical protein n=1 Tax=Alkaliphilus sp. B6464 TaxID=2731219 RepID=UPI001BAD749C|nr:hypothetical protein [Alkaliphilus sp. B6464]QUH22117.1 hypothetical protein HYG84_19615 [Alkaliphilus sp. B6464]
MVGEKIKKDKLLEKNIIYRKDNNYPSTVGLIKTKDIINGEISFHINKSNKDSELYTSKDKFKNAITEKELIFSIRHKKYTISQDVINKFRNKNIRKIYEVIDIFLKSGNIQLLEDEKAIITMKLYDIKFLINYRKRTINGIIQDKGIDIKDNSITFKKGKAIILEDNEIKEDKIIFRKDVFLEQLYLLEGVNIDKNKVIEDIRCNLKEIELFNRGEEIISIETTKCKYEIINYNIKNTILKMENFDIYEKLEGITQSKKDNKVDIANIMQQEYLTNLKVLDLYGGIETAKNYIKKVGLSIKVITKFITEENLSELFRFLVDDVVYHGIVLYDNYIDNCMIIKTKRFYYLLKNNVIINIKTTNQEEIEDCSISFKKVQDRFVTEKRCILDLELRDRVRDIISQFTINGLKMRNHAKARYKERISKDADISMIELDIKKDIYKNGVVCMGTYYQNTKLIKGHKYIYIIDNNYIISVWRINPTVIYVEKRYNDMIDELVMTELEEVI